MREGVVLDVARAVAQRLELRQLGGDRGALVDEALPDIAERPLQLLVAERLVGVLLELR